MRSIRTTGIIALRHTVDAWAKVRDCDAAIRRARIEGTATMITGMIGASIGVGLDNIPACLVGLACLVDAILSLCTWRRLLALRDRLEWEAEHEDSQYLILRLRGIGREGLN